MSDNAGKLSLARKFRGITHAMITCLETKISKLENKREITHSDSVKIQGRVDKLNSLQELALDKAFLTYAYELNNFSLWGRSSTNTRNYKWHQTAKDQCPQLRR